MRRRPLDDEEIDDLLDADDDDVGPDERDPNFIVSDQAIDEVFGDPAHDPDVDLLKILRDNGIGH